MKTVGRKPIGVRIPGPPHMHDSRLWCLARPRRRLAALAVLWAACGPTPGETVSPEPDPLHRLGWLAGCWRLEAGDRTTDEQWMAPRGGMMMGMSRTVIGGRVRETERLLIRADSGRVEYIADPSGQRETVFTAMPSTGPEWVFVNEAHDFPQRIIYRPEGSTRLLARIEGVVDGRLRVVEFPMERIDCRLPAGR